MFVDEIKLKIRSGNGGSGCLSFHRERHIAKGGPDGGDGGLGGAVILQVNEHLSSLHSLKFRNLYAAKNGLPGEGNQKSGKKGVDLVLEVPRGTVVRDIKQGDLVVDFGPDTDRWIVAEGGRGGKGNFHFRSSVNQIPRNWQKGEEGIYMELTLSLKLIADVGLVGLPNAGKSSLLSVVSSARPKVADYPFTTLTPHLGTHVYPPSLQVVFADIPGLIHGANEGKGLGMDFLKHIERTGIIVHLVEPCPMDGSSVVENVRSIRKELGGYSKILSEKKEVLVLSKMDLNPDPEEIKEWEEELGEKFLQISSATHQGIDVFLKRISDELFGDDF